MAYDFEGADGAAWGLIGSAEVNASHGSHSGSQSLYLFAKKGGLDPTQTSGASRTFASSPGVPINVSMWVNADASSAVYAQVSLVSGGVSDDFELPNLGSGWQLWDIGPYTPSGATIDVVFLAFVLGSLGIGSWLVDDLALEGEARVAVMGFELPLRAMLATLQASLNTEIGHVGAEANDGLVPHSIEQWYCWRKKELAVNRALCEVYEVGGSTIKDWNSQTSTWYQGQRVPLRTEHTLSVAVTFANRGLTPTTRTLKMSELKVLAMRYAIAVLRTVRNQPDLGQTDKIYCEPGETVITYGDDDPTDAAPGLVRIEVPFTVSVSESSANETVTGGGPRPSAILES